MDFVPLKEKYPDLVDDFRESPEHVINCLGLAFHTFVQEYLTQLTDTRTKTTSTTTTRSQDADVESKQTSKRLVVIDSLLVGRSVPKIHVRLAGFQNDTKLKDLRHNVYGRLITVKGSADAFSGG